MQKISQLGQDEFVINRLNGLKNGYFVDIGASDGVSLSNTYKLEKEYGWTGLCVEPNPEYYEQLLKNRECLKDNSVLFSKKGVEVDFCLAGACGGIKDLFMDHDGERDPRRQSAEVIKLRTETLDNLLKRYDVPRHINYISIDTEGSELEILQTLDFTTYNIDILTVEHNQNLRQDNYLYQIMKFMSQYDYNFKLVGWDIFCFKDSI